LLCKRFCSEQALQPSATAVQDKETMKITSLQSVTEHSLWQCVESSKADVFGQSELSKLWLSYVMGAELQSGSGVNSWHSLNSGEDVY